jgi:hypothetical protein
LFGSPFSENGVGFIFGYKHEKKTDDVHHLSKNRNLYMIVLCKLQGMDKNPGFPLFSYAEIYSHVLLLTVS